MYGLLLEGIYYYLRTIFGEEVLKEIRVKANINHVNFSTHQIYSETVIPRIARASQEVTGMPVEELMESFGMTFVSFVAKYGYDRILKVLGRNVRDFLSNLDNLHEYLRFSYPKIKPPSFFVTDETSDGLTLHYRSKRRGFKNYLIGQVRQVGKEFYNTDIKCEEVSVDESHGTVHVVLRLKFPNVTDDVKAQDLKSNYDMSITPQEFFSLFPFHMVIDREMVILSIGDALRSVLPHLIGSQLDDLFHLERPIIDFTWENILSHTNNVFEMQSVDIIENRYDDNLTDSNGREDASVISGPDHNDDTNTVVSSHGNCKKTLVLRGQMLFMREWNAILFLGTPVMENLEHMFRLGLYINDLSIHDSSRELVLAGTQQSAELKLLLDQELIKSKKLEDSMRKLDTEMKKTDQLLYQMIPKSVADRLRAGEPSVSTCEVFDICTILFSDVIGFTTICSAISPMQVVSMLNGMYTSFDTLIEKHSLYKVETIGDAYMIVGGVPKKSDAHALNIVQMAFSMLNAVKTLKDPSDRTGRTHLQLRIGIHSGTCVAGVVGLKMPRYCLFGDTVNTASRMESNGEAMKIHCSDTTKECMSDYPQYTFIERGSVEIKGKGAMTTYWLQRDEAKDAAFRSKQPSAATKCNDVPESQLYSQMSKTLSVPKHFMSEPVSAPPVLKSTASFSSVNNNHADSKPKHNVVISSPAKYMKPEPDENTYETTISAGMFDDPSAKLIKEMEPTATKQPSPRIAAIEPSPVKPFNVRNSSDTKADFDVQKNQKTHVVTANNGCSTTCILL